ncbi:hypothetical protein [Pseudogulbenkiania sp. MAI-1]|uniref:hypothetical protein n=1 Tax=Pseudogulbenkiania sp. MAI-1 TaxID=990370 RepID=UPI0012EB39DD|nr:hypothetical protein [Pseudogulbenkiania sp. MAI-1]
MAQVVDNAAHAPDGRIDVIQDYNPHPGSGFIFQLPLPDGEHSLLRQGNFQQGLTRLPAGSRAR